MEHQVSSQISTDLPDPREHDTVPLLHFDFNMVEEEDLWVKITQWWNNEEAAEPALQYLGLHSSSWGEADRFRVENALEPAL